ncbi:hypothetical protein BT69DRAFT_300916 [Atractiella rhizophila]|nr:hypothetical protein BT69DRAFT_300916 [Atractiella rhizophila]
MSKFLGKMSTSVAHTSKMPMLGPKDLRLLGNIINTEKGVMTSMSTLSAETHKAAEALRVWGKIEGDDLGDVLGKITILLDQLSTAENKYAEHNATYRQYFKAVRTREEALVQLKKTKESVAARIEALEKKLSKMNPEHKDAPGLHVKLRETRSELSGLDFAVMNEEARLGDFKRDTTREAMGLKLGALLEMSEKSTIIAELGKLLLEEIPRDRTEPGNPRVLYRGWTRTDEILDEAKRCLQEVVFNPSPGGTIGGGVPPLNREESPAGGRDTALATENQENGHHPEPTNATSDWEMVSKHQQLPSSISYAPPPQPQGNQDVYENHHMSIYGGLNSDPYTHQEISTRRPLIHLHHQQPLSRAKEYTSANWDRRIQSGSRLSVSTVSQIRRTDPASATICTTPSRSPPPRARIFPHSSYSTSTIPEFSNPSIPAVQQPSRLCAGVEVWLRYVHCASS